MPVPLRRLAFNRLREAQRLWVACEAYCPIRRTGDAHAFQIGCDPNALGSPAISTRIAFTECPPLPRRYLSNWQHLIAVDDGANQSKGARGPDGWKPPLASYWCQYAVDWITIKNTWSLSVTPADWALQSMMGTRVGGSPATTRAPVVATLRPTLTPISTASPTATPSGYPIGTRTGVPALYDPFGPDQNCEDFSTWAQAQDFYEAAGGNNAHRLDRNKDGVACQSLPGAP